MREVVLSARHISKEYPGTKALDNVNFDIKKGKVNVLIGENGAGKSTLMRIVAGIEQPTSGELYMGEEKVSFKNTAEARKHGIAIIHQELSLFKNLNVTQNIFINNEKIKGKVIIDNNQEKLLAKKVLEKMNYPIDPDAMVSDLRVGQQQMIEIAKNLAQDDVKILIMDEPTSSLSSEEVQQLFKIMRDLLEKGIAIVYISHRLEEIMQIGDNVTVFRNGKLVAHADVNEIDIPQIVTWMTGKAKDYSKKISKIDYQTAENILEVRDLCLPKRGGGYLLDHVSFDLKKGEVLGIYGLMGAGRTEIFECIMGLRPEHTGSISLEGKKLQITNISSQIDKGFALVPEDRQHEGLVQTLNIGRNISLSILNRIAKAGFLKLKEEDNKIEYQIKSLRIKVADKKLPILSLSGGNQQKVVIGKGLLTNPKVLLLDEPSRGIDIGAKTEVFEIIDRLSEKGLSCIVVSSELKEILSVSDRIIVLSNGRVTGEFAGSEINNDNLVLASYKGHHKETA